MGQDHPATADVVIVGAGVVGCSIARELATDHTVVVIDAGQIAGGTTGHASGLVSIVQDWKPQFDAARYAIEFFREFDGTAGFTFNERPSVRLATEAGVETAQEIAEAVETAGFEAEYLDAVALDERYPAVFDRDTFVGGTVFADTGWVDPYSYTMALKSSATNRGAHFEPGTKVTEIHTDGDAVTGVTTDAGTIDADWVITAAGWQTRSLLDGMVTIPTRPFRYQTVNLAIDRELDGTYPMGWERLSRLYWRPEHNGELHVGGGPYFVADPTDQASGPTAAFRRLVADRIPQYLTGIGDARIVGGATCPSGDAASPDGYPLVGTPAEAPDGLVVATGMHGLGVMGSPVVARQVRATVTGDPPPFDSEFLDPDRFGSNAATFTSSYIEETPEAWRPGAREWRVDPDAEPASD
ncbi:MAG: FAD-dependent oxidoreductase [Halobacteriales archaeon]|nr:FAD-dependent oxidoreductase [Halobacteriales archaeon]